MSIPQQLEDALLRCLAKKADDRPDAAELATLLRTVPLGDAWTDAKAGQWWRQFQTENAKTTALAERSTRSITIDIGDRAQEALRLSA